MIDERKSKQFKYETTFIGFKSTKVLEFKKIENIYKVTVNFVSEVITCIKDKNNKDYYIKKPIHCILGFLSSLYMIYSSLSNKYIN